MTSGHLTLILVNFFQIKAYYLNAYVIFSVQTQSAWDLCQPVGPARPAQRTGHACVTYQDRIIMYVPHVSSGSAHIYVCTASEERMVNTITMIHGPMILIQGCGLSSNVSVLFPPREKVTQPLWSTTSSTYLAGGV
jgi:hypothetical protein